jgi:hypothetical protein
MSAQIYAAPKELKIPKIDFTNYGKYTKECKEYLDKLKEYCLENSDEEYVGEIVRIPHADGNAEYMVASMKPLELIHIPLGDAYDSEFAEYLTVEKVKEKIQGAKNLAKLFGK